MKTEHLIKLGVKTAVVSFLTGTLILLLYYVSLNSLFAFLGLFFFLGAGLVNIIVLIILLIRAGKDSECRTKLLRTSTLLLLNIPVSIVYFWLGTILANTMRITVYNNTKSVITKAHFTGCNYEKLIERMEPGESKMISFHIPGDCGVSVVYMLNGKQQDEDVSGYVTNEGGAWINYNIGGPNQLY